MRNLRLILIYLSFFVQYTNRTVVSFLKDGVFLDSRVARFCSYCNVWQAGVEIPFEVWQWSFIHLLHMRQGCVLPILGQNVKDNKYGFNTVNDCSQPITHLLLFSQVCALLKFQRSVLWQIGDWELFLDHTCNQVFHIWSRNFIHLVRINQEVLYWFWSQKVKGQGQ